MSRRRRKNPLLARILVISIVVHIIGIPILAKFGAFEKIKRQFVTANVTVAPPPPLEKDKPIEKKEAKKQTAKSTKGASHASKSSQQSHGAPHPAVAAAASDGKSGDGGDTVDPGSGKAGVVPKDPGTTTPKTEPPTKPEPKVEPKVEPTQPKPVTPTEPKPIAKVVEPKVAPHVPVFAEASVEKQVQPEIPDDLRLEALDKTSVIDVTISESGAVTAARVMTSCGVPELDALALSSAKQWKFRPAQRDAQPVVSHAHLHIEFKVD